MLGEGGGSADVDNVTLGKILSIPLTQNQHDRVQLSVAMQPSSGLSHVLIEPAS